VPITYASSTAPVRLFIPAIGVDAGVQNVGITRKGTMAVPTNYKDVGWYRYGPVPGKSGSAVMAGHLDNGFGLSAVFKRLADLKENDDVFITDVSGHQLHFRVIKTGMYDYNASTKDIFASSSNARLNLITCEGTWNTNSKMYSNRRVVFTELVGLNQ
jgi:sortase A